MIPPHCCQTRLIGSSLNNIYLRQGGIIEGLRQSIHILKYIDDPHYRCDIRKALNRGEAYHQLLKIIGSIGGGDFRGMSDMEVEIWNECMRLLALIRPNVKVRSMRYQLVTI